MSAASPAPVRPVAIIDIGSNSIRLVVYEGGARAPALLFNEKIMAGLGRGLATTGRIDDEAMTRALAALDRFCAVAREMGAAPLTVATAAVRDASNGAELIDGAARLGLDVRLLSGDEEAALAAEGVMAGVPDADGIVGDLGGGSLELARVSGGRMGRRASFPLGVLRVAAIRKRGPRALATQLDKALKGGAKSEDWAKIGAGRPLYLVGGSWRALARLDMVQTGFPLPIAHQYRMEPGAAARLVRVLARSDPKTLKAIPGISQARLANLGDAAAVLALLAKRLQVSAFIVSAWGLREGLYHRGLAEGVQARDPLLEALRAEGGRGGRFAEHGDLIHRWIGGLFAGEDAADARLRHAACLLADIGWRAHPDFRAERGVETALHGNWVGIDARGRGMLAQALHVNLGGSGVVPEVARLCDAAAIERASRWGLALRLAQRLSAGAAGPIARSRLAVSGTRLSLTLPPGDRALYGEMVERRHKALALALGLKPELALS